MTKAELEDDYIDWFAFASDDVQALEEQGFIHAFFVEDPDADLSALGSHARVTDEFPHGDILYFKGIGPNPRLWKEAGIWPISMATKRAAKVAVILHQTEGDNAIELYSERFSWAAAIHPCARPGCEWQGSMLDKYGPFSHVESDTVEGALDQLFERASDWVYQPGAVDATVTEIEQFRHPLHANPPFSGWRDAWWLEKMPRDVTKIAYRRKRDALLVFMDWNGRLIDLAFNGPSQEHPADSFDNFNSKYELKGKRKITNFTKAVWFALPAGAPYYLEDIDVNMLNDTQPMIHNAEEQQLSLPDYAEERRLVDLEAAYWEERYSLLPEEDDEVPF